LFNQVILISLLIVPTEMGIHLKKLANLSQRK